MQNKHLQNNKVENLLDDLLDDYEERFENYEEQEHNQNRVKNRHKHQETFTQKQQNTRRCIVTREDFHKKDLLRFVVGPNNELYFDINNKLPGRGMWVQATKESLETALEKNLFSRSAKMKVNIDNNFKENTKQLLRTQLLQTIKLSNKAGLVICGFDKIYEQIKYRSANYHYYIEALDSAKNGSEKILNIIGHMENIKHINIFTSEELSQSFNKVNVVHSLIKSDPLTRNIKKIYKNFLLFS